MTGNLLIDRSFNKKQAHRTYEGKGARERMNSSQRLKAFCAETAYGLALVGSLLAGCSEPAPDQIKQPLSYHRDIAPIVDNYCGSCHSHSGIGHFSLGTFAEVSRYAPLIRGAVANGTMPPWLPSQDSRPLHGSRLLRTQDKDDLLRWIDEGMAEGNPSDPPRTDLPPKAVVTPPRADLVLDPGRNYLPDGTQNDDYHCFVFDPKLTTDRFITAGDALPGNHHIVHHIIAYEIPEAEAAAIKAKDPTGQGYTCFGSPGTMSPPVTILGWAPGGVATRYPQGTALRLHKGSLLVMQVHYNMLEGKGQADRTTMQFELTDEAPQKELHSLPVARPKQLLIPAGAADAVQTIEFPLSVLLSRFGLPSSKLTVYGHTPHMHLLGTKISTELNGAKLIDIPRWDFHWQQGYMFQSPYQASGNDTFKLECHYNNTAEHQPVVGGVKQTPRDVTWGEGTLDEMCLNYLLLSAE